MQGGDSAWIEQDFYPSEQSPEMTQKHCAQYQQALEIQGVIHAAFIIVADF